jgi:hypothetical protein
MVSFRDLTSAIDADRGAMRDLLAALVAIPTENPPATGYLPCVALLESTQRSNRESSLNDDHSVALLLCVKSVSSGDSVS